jgi:thimet oligopeptidase
MRNIIALHLALILAFPPAFAADLAAPGAQSIRPSAGLPVNFQLAPAELGARFTAAQAELETALSGIASLDAAQYSFANTIGAFERATAILNDKVQPMIFLAYVSPDEKVREAAQKLEEDFGKYAVNLMMREDVYNAIKAYAAKGEALTGEDKRLLEETLKSFERYGAALEPARRAEFKNVQERLAVIASQFSANINKDDGTIEATREELEGMPQSFIDSLEKLDGGKYKLTLKYPHVRPVMASAKNEALRKRMDLAYNNRALENMPLLQETLKLRHRVGQLLGFKDFPAFELQSRMAQNPENVRKFLYDLLPLVREKGRKELEELLSAKKKDDPAAERINSWDAKYYSTKVRNEKFGFDEEEVSQYFPVDRVVAGTMRVYERVLGVKFTEVSNEGAWHPDVRVFRIDDAASGKQIAHFALDLHPRDGKYSHAAVFPIIQGREQDGGYNRPLAAMVANFTKPQGDRPSLFKWEEVNTFFHEFGHVVHDTLTQAKFSTFAGANTARDFVEAPSQMMEEFIWEPEVVAELSDKWDEPGKKLPAELLEKMRAASVGYEDGSNLMRGLHYLRQLSFAIIDMVFHTAVPETTTELYQQISELITMQPSQPGVHPEASFGHIQGYGAGYYSYLWAEVFAQDIYSVFKKEGIFSGAGMRYRKAILERGSSRPEMESLKDFLGREPNAEAFIAKLNGVEAPGPASPTAFSAEALDGARAAGLEKPLTGLDDPRLNDPKALVAEGWAVEGAPEADVVHYRFPARGQTIQEYTTDIYGERDFESLVTRWTAQGRRWNETLSRGSDNKVELAKSSRETKRAAGTISPDFLNAARRQGLANPLTGFDDARHLQPELLLAENWVKSGGQEVEFYRYEVGGKTTQLFARSMIDGKQAIVTVDHASGKKESIVRLADGRFERTVGDAAVLLTSLTEFFAAPKAPEAPKQISLWGVVQKVKGAPHDVSAQADEVVSAREWSTGWLWWKKKFTTYMVRVSPEELAKFEAAGFKPIKSLNVKLTWTHVADMNGWGTGVNGSRRGSFTQDLRFPVDKLEDAFALLQEFEKNPEAVLARYPENEKWLRELGQAWDRGYVIDSSIQVVTGSRTAGDETLLFSDGARSGYYR